MSPPKGLPPERIRATYLTFYSALIYDELEKLGYPNQALATSIKPIAPEMKVAGPAFTMKASSDPRLDESRFGLQVLDAIVPHAVVVYDTGHDSTVGHWGEIMSTCARMKGAQGTVIDGGTRDSAYIVRMGFPVFVRYRTPVEARGRFRLSEYQTPINMPGAISSNVTIDPGDYVFGDIDGVVVVPKALTLEVMRRAKARMRQENKVRAGLKAGSSAVEVFRKFGAF